MGESNRVNMVITKQSIRYAYRKHNMQDADMAGIAENPRYMQVEGIRLKDGDPVRLDISLTVYHRE